MVLVQQVPAEEPMMLEQVALRRKRVESHRSVHPELVDEIWELARSLRGARVLHLNATAVGGGVAEILGTMVPLLNDLGVRAEWRVIQGGDDLFQVTKAMHNLLQGMDRPWTVEMRDTWLRYNEINAAFLAKEDYDFVWVHDPQPAGVLRVLEDAGQRRGRWIWRCHIDLSDANENVWRFLSGYVESYEAAVFTLPQYVRDGLSRPRIYVAPPAIDPLSPKNRHLGPRQVRQILGRFPVDLSRPFLLQVSRFDPWKDPLGVIDLYRLVKAEMPQLQLVMSAAMANDDPEGARYFELTARRAGEDFDIHLVDGSDPLVVNAFQRAADVVLQMSTREGFGLVVSEALWKGRPVVARGVGGIPLQVIDGETGRLVSSTDEAAERVYGLLESPDEARALGFRGQEHVRQNFLISRYLRDHLRVMNDLAAGASTNGHTNGHRNGAKTPSGDGIAAV